MYIEEELKHLNFEKITITYNGGYFSDSKIEETITIYGNKVNYLKTQFTFIESKSIELINTTFLISDLKLLQELDSHLKINTLCNDDVEYGVCDGSPISLNVKYRHGIIVDKTCFLERLPSNIENILKIVRAIFKKYNPLPICIK